MSNPINTNLGTAGYVLTSNGAGNLPTYQPNSGGGKTFSMNRQVFTYTGSTQTYTPTTGMVYCDVEVVGGGAGAGGSYNGGFGGGYAKKLISATTIGASQTITIGAGGTSSLSVGGTGGTTYFGSLIYATGGIGSSGTIAPGFGSGGDINASGYAPAFSSFPFDSAGGSCLGGGGWSVNFNPHASLSYGGGGANGTGVYVDGNAGVCIITEYIFV